ncbi:MAG: hypothetical protein DHS20C01_00420 [marine bacterium B5-7]|nr:MAG: hypothetical protein DHS20C01_00420 [marine bacterium B5-7]
MNNSDTTCKRRIKPFYEELDLLYLKILKRNIDHSGYFTYATVLERGQKSLKDVEAILKASPEHINRTRSGSGN